MSNKDRNVVFEEKGIREMADIRTCLGTTTVDPGAVDAFLQAHEEWHTANSWKSFCRPTVTPVRVPYWISRGGVIT